MALHIVAALCCTAVALSNKDDAELSSLRTINFWSITENASNTNVEAIDDWWVNGSSYMTILWAVIYGTQVLLALLLTGSFGFHIPIKILLMFGVVFRDNLTTNFNKLSHCFVSTFYHLHMTHLLMNMAGMYTGFQFFKPLIDEDSIWVMYSQFPVWCAGALVGSILSYRTTLHVAAITVGASGGAIGSSVAYVATGLLVGGYPKDSHRTWMLSQALITLCLEFLPAPKPKDMQTGSGQSVPSISDFGSHFGGMVGGTTFLLLLYILSLFTTQSTMITVCMILSYIFAGFSLICFANVFRIYVFHGKTRKSRFYGMKILKLKYRSIDSIESSLYAKDYLTCYSADGRVEGRNEIEEDKRLERNMLDKIGFQPSERERLRELQNSDDIY